MRPKFHSELKNLHAKTYTICASKGLGKNDAIMVQWLYCNNAGKAVINAQNLEAVRTSQNMDALRRRKEENVRRIKLLWLQFAPQPAISADVIVGMWMILEIWCWYSTIEYLWTHFFM